ncbi:hypothetical protein SEUCBS139899_005544 [Sporothrix eucalyptigena]
MCSWYRSDEYGKTIMWMFVSQSVSSIIGSLLVYGISYMDGIRGLSAWQWVFLIEGLVTIVFSGVIYVLLPDWPRSERSKSWLTLAEQEYLEASVSSCPAGYGLSWQLPTIITSLGFAKLPANKLLNNPPAVAKIIGQLFVALLLRHASFVRPYINVAICAATLIFYIATGTAFALAAQTAIAQVGATIAPLVFPAHWAYNGYKKSFYVCTACVSVAFMTLITWYLTRHLEREVLQVRQERIHSEKQNKFFDGEDVHVFDNRVTYTNV